MEEVAMGCESFTDAISASHSATDRIMRGDAGGFKDLYSRSGDITLGNPFGGFGRGREGVFEQLDRAASYFSDGRATEFEEIAKAAADEFAYTVEIERVEVKVAGGAEQSEICRSGYLGLSPRRGRLETRSSPCRPESLSADGGFGAADLRFGPRL